MDPLITAAGRALAAGHPLGALKRVALRDDAPALALRGVAMAQLGELVRAKALLRSAARAGPEAERRIWTLIIARRGASADKTLDLSPEGGICELAKQKSDCGGVINLRRQEGPRLVELAL
jgi:hypothetical protein